MCNLYIIVIIIVIVVVTPGIYCWVCWCHESGICWFFSGWLWLGKVAPAFSVEGPRIWCFICKRQEYLRFWLFGQNCGWHGCWGKGAHGSYNVNVCTCTTPKVSVQWLERRWAGGSNMAVLTWKSPGSAAGLSHTLANPSSSFKWSWLVGVLLIPDGRPRLGLPLIWPPHLSKFWWFRGFCIQVLHIQLSFMFLYFWHWSSHAKHDHPCPYCIHSEKNYVGHGHCCTYCTHCLLWKDLFFLVHINVEFFCTTFIENQNLLLIVHLH